MQNYFQLHEAGNLTTFNADLVNPPDFTNIPEFFGNVTSGAYFGALEPFPNDEPANEPTDRTRANLAVQPNEIEVSGHALCHGRTPGTLDR